MARLLWSCGRWCWLLHCFIYIYIHIDYIALMSSMVLLYSMKLVQNHQKISVWLVVVAKSKHLERNSLIIWKLWSKSLVCKHLFWRWTKLWKSQIDVWMLWKMSQFQRFKLLSIILTGNYCCLCHCFFVVCCCCCCCCCYFFCCSCGSISLTGCLVCCYHCCCYLC